MRRWVFQARQKGGEEELKETGKEEAEEDLLEGTWNRSSWPEASSRDFVAGEESGVEADLPNPGSRL